jgi:hypothetical protein
MAEAFSLRESESDVAGFLFERNGSENLMGDFALLVQDEGDARSGAAAAMNQTEVSRRRMRVFTVMCACKADLFSRRLG